MIFFQITQGVRQGCILSPHQFNIFNDITDSIPGDLGENCGNAVINFLMYVDDLAVMTDSEIALQNILKVIGMWCQTNHLEFNETKSSVVHFRKKSVIAPSVDFYMNDKRIEVVTEYKYLGILLNEYLNFESIYNDNLIKIERAFFRITHDWCKRGEIRQYVFKKIVRALVFLIFDYGSLIWGPFIGRPKREVMNLKIARFFLGVSPLHPINAVENDMGWETKTERHYLQSLLYYRKLLIMNQDNKVFRWMKSEYNQQNWVGMMKSLMNRLDLEEATLMDCDEREARNMLKLKLYLMEKARWNEEIDRKPKLESLPFDFWI